MQRFLLRQVGEQRRVDLVEALQDTKEGDKSVSDRQGEKRFVALGRTPLASDMPPFLQMPLSKNLSNSLTPSPLVFFTGLPYAFLPARTSSKSCALTSGASVRNDACWRRRS